MSATDMPLIDTDDMWDEVAQPTPHNKDNEV